MVFLDFNFAPLFLRRDISILGFIHKRIIGECHLGIKQLLLFSDISDRWHHKQLEKKAIVSWHDTAYITVLFMDMCTCLTVSLSF